MWVDVCLAVSCHLHFWQNGWDLLRATEVTRGSNEYRNKPESARKLILEKKILRQLMQGLQPGTFRSQVRRSNHWPTSTSCLLVCECRSCVFGVSITLLDDFRVNARGTTDHSEFQDDINEVASLGLGISVLGHGLGSSLSRDMVYFPVPSDCKQTREVCVCVCACECVCN